MEYALEVESLRKSYPRFSLDGISLALPAWRGMELAGENGSGKTAFLKAALCPGKADSGRVAIFGRPPAKALEDVGAVFKGTRLPGRLPLKDLAGIVEGFYKATFDLAFLKDALERCSIGLDARIGALPPAMLDLALVYMALARHPRLLALDDVMEGAPEKAVADLAALLKARMEARELSLVVSGRVPAPLGSICGLVALLCDGRLVVFGSKEELVARHRIIELPEKDDLTPAARRRLIAPRRLKDGRIRALVEAKDFKENRHSLREPLLSEVLSHLARREEARR